MKIFFFLSFVLISILTNAQNLVPNGDFEKVINLPIKKNPKNSFKYEKLSGYKPYLYNIEGWFAATESTPDLRITDLEAFKTCEKIYPDCDKARSGVISAGIITYQKNRKYETFREYLEVKLIEKLEVGKTVNFELWVRKERQAKLVTNNIGCYLTEKKVAADIVDHIKVQPQYNFDTLINLSNSEWIKIHGQFEIDKPYEYLTIGNFFSNEDTKVKPYEKYQGQNYIPPYAYYLIDDVKLWYDGTSPTNKNEKEIPIAKKEIVVPTIAKETVIEDVAVAFEYDSSIIKPGSTSKLDELIDLIKNKNSTAQIDIIGHTDDRGSEAYNLELSTNRAKSIYEYMINRGVENELLSYKGLGESSPLIGNIDEASRKRNRRVEVRIGN